MEKTGAFPPTFGGVKVCDIHNQTHRVSQQCPMCELEILRAKCAELDDEVTRANGAWNMLANISDTLRTVGLDASHGATDERVIKLKAKCAAMESVVKTVPALISLASRQVCSHDETYRGGTIWEICSMCGAKWADDEGGKPDFVEPAEITAAEIAYREYREKGELG